MRIEVRGTPTSGKEGGHVTAQAGSEWTVSKFKVFLVFTSGVLQGAQFLPLALASEPEG